MFVTAKILFTTICAANESESILSYNKVIKRLKISNDVSCTTKVILLALRLSVLEWRRKLKYLKKTTDLQQYYNKIISQLNRKKGIELVDEKSYNS